MPKIQGNWSLVEDKEDRMVWEHDEYPARVKVLKKRDYYNVRKAWRNSDGGTSKDTLKKFKNKDDALNHARGWMKTFYLP